MAKVTLSKDILNDLYNKQGKTLKEIGQIYSITRERVRQIMESFGIKRNRFRPHKQPHKRFFIYNSLEEYLLRDIRRLDATSVLERFLPKVFCAECGSKRHLHFHHIKYKATSQEDIQVLCASCHKMKHKKGMTLIKQAGLYADYLSGMPYRQLMAKYNLSQPGVYQTIVKVRDGWHTYRG